MNRIDYFDHLKAFGITLVVYEHFKGVPNWLAEWIFSFHMPLFFFVTGCLTRSEQLAGSFKKFAGHNARQLLLPYLLFGLIGYVWWFVIGRNYGSNTNEVVAPHEPILAFLWGSAKDMVRQPLTPSPLWFLPCLFAAKCVLALTFRLPKMLYAGSILLLAGIGIWSLQQPKFLPPFGLDSALASLPFLAVGQWWRSKQFMLPAKTSSKIAMGTIGLTIGAIICYLSNQPPRHVADAAAFDIRAGNFGPWIIPAYLGALATLCGLVALFQPIPGFSLSSRLSGESLTILALHPIVFGAMKGALSLGLHWTVEPDKNYLIAPLFSVICLALIIWIAAPVLRKCGVLGAGQRKSMLASA